MWENADQNNSEYGHFLRSDHCKERIPHFLSALEGTITQKMRLSKELQKEEEKEEKPELSKKK